MPPPSLKILLTHLEWNLQRLEEILKNEATEYYRDAALQRFGHCMDMAVKCLEAAAAQEESKTGSAGFHRAVENRWIADTEHLESMLADHAALPEKSESAPPAAVFEKLDRYHAILNELYASLTARAGQDQ